MTIVEEDTYGKLSKPRLAPLSDGGFVVVWRDEGYLGEMHPGVMARRYSSRCLPSGDAFRVDDESAAMTGPPSVAGLATDGFVVVWLEETAAGPSIYARAFDIEGNPSGDPMVVDSPEETRRYSRSDPVVAATDPGQFVVVWTEYLGLAEERGIVQPEPTDGDRAGLIGRVDPLVTRHSANE